MSILSAAEVYRLAIGAGFTADQAVTMTAIAGAESGYNTAARGDVGLQTSKWGPSIGLWQIRSLWEHAGTGKERDATRLTDPTFNARAARIVYGQQGFGAWSVYTKGTYHRFDDTARKAQDDAEHHRGGSSVPSVPGPAGDLLGKLPGVDSIGGAAMTSAGGVFAGINAAGEFFGSLSQRATWVRVTQVLGGTTLVIAGLAWLGRDLVKPVASLATDVIPQAKALKVAGTVAKAGQGAKAVAAVGKAKAAGAAAAKTVSGKS